MSSGEIETVTVIRPLKILAFVCGCLSLLLCIVCIASPNWLEAKGFRQGLWDVCYRQTPESENICESNDKDWLTASAALSIIALIFIAIGTVVTGIALFLKKSDTRKSMFVGSIAAFAFAVVLLIITLIIFPVMFVQQIADYRDKYGIETWYFAWAYGIAWGSAIFSFGAAVLLFIDKDNDDILYREKDYYET